MRYLMAALALAFAVSLVSAAQACPNDMKTAATQIAAADGQSAPASTKVRVPARPGG